MPLRARPADSEAGQALVYKGLMHPSPNHPPDRKAYALFLFHFLETDFSRTGQAQRHTLWAWKKREAVRPRLDRSRAAAVVNDECDVLVRT